MNERTVDIEEQEALLHFGFPIWIGKRELRRVHHQNCYHASEKSESGNRGNAQDDQTHWVTRHRATPKRGPISETRRGCARFGGSRFPLRFGGKNQLRHDLICYVMSLRMT